MCNQLHLARAQPIIGSAVCSPGACRSTELLPSERKSGVVVRWLLRPAPAEDRSVGGEPRVVDALDRSAPADPDADVSEVAVQHHPPVEGRVEPGLDHLAGGVVVAEVLGEPPRLLALRVAGPANSPVQPGLAWALVTEAVVGEHPLRVALRGEL